MISDSWFEGISCDLGLYNLGFQAIKIITTGAAGYCKQELQDKIKVYDITRGEYVADVTTLDGVKMIVIEYWLVMKNKSSKLLD